eukprot:779632-Rhodomonas_salina.1
MQKTADILGQHSAVLVSLQKSHIALSGFCHRPFCDCDSKTALCNGADLAPRPAPCPGSSRTRVALGCSLLRPARTACVPRAQRHLTRLLSLTSEPESHILEAG